MGMNEISDQIIKQNFDNLQLQKLVKNQAYEILTISLEKDAIFPEHASPTDAHLVVLEGDIVFHLKGENFHLKKQQYFNFPKEVKHWIKANMNSKFLVIR